MCLGRVAEEERGINVSITVRMCVFGDGERVGGRRGEACI